MKMETRLEKEALIKAAGEGRLSDRLINRIIGEEGNSDKGIIFFDYPFEGHFFISSELKEELKKDKEKYGEYSLRTEKMREILESVYSNLVIGALAYHEPGDFRVEIIEKLNAAQIRNKNRFTDATWGEYWRLGS